VLSFLLLIICVGEVEELCSVHHQQHSIISAGTNTNIDMVYDVKISLNERNLQNKADKVLLLEKREKIK